MAYNPGGQPPFNPQPPFGAPPPPPPKAGMSTGAKVAIFGCIGLIFLGAIIAIVAVVFTVYFAPGNSNTISTGSNTSNTSNTSSSPSTKNTNTSTTNTSSTKTSGISVASIEMATEKGGQPGDTVQSFSPTDNPMHFVIKLNDSAKGTKVRVVLMAVSVSTGDKDTKVGELDYETKALEDRVNAQFELPRDWPTGSWRLEVYINGVLDETRDFQVS